MIGNFNEEAQNILVKAKLEMLELKHPYVGTEHLVLSILKNKSSLQERLNEYNLTYDKFKAEIVRLIGVGSKKSELFLYTPLLKKVIENAIIDSKENNDGEVTIQHLFSALLEEGEGIAIRIFIGMNLDVDNMYDEFASKLIKHGNKKGKKLLIEELGVDLTEKAMNKELDPVIGREEETQRLLEVLCRRTKNNPILIGKAGVGKTAIVEELSRMIVSGNVPSNLLHKKIISLDMATAVAGTKYRGEFEERMKKILKEIEDNQDIILFIDEIHTLVGAGGAEGAIDASNILKPALARGKLRCIGATTLEEYKKFIEKDSALERRFQKVIIDEPDLNKTKNILMKLKPIYEKYHHVIIRDSIIDDIISLSEKYIYDRSQPDKAIDILDEVCSRVRIKDDHGNHEVENLRKEIEELDKIKNSYIIDNNISKAYEYRKQETELMSKLNELELGNKVDSNYKEVSKEDIAKVINVRTHIPVYEIMQDKIKVIKKIESDLSEIVVGQNKATSKLINITKRIKLGYFDHKCYSMLMVGPTGVGKSLIAKTYGELLVGRDNVIRLDMSEYSDATSVNKIVGSAPGYVGYDDNKNILEEIRNKPNAVILLDEIEKAHPKVINLFYQILDEGRIKDSKGNVIRLDNNIILMTSNVGFERNLVGFNEMKEDNVLSSLKKEFSVSFINRVDDIVTFNRLELDDIKLIIEKKLDLVKKKYSDLEISFEDEVINSIVDKANYKEFGARQIDKIITKDIENIIIDGIINGKKKMVITNDMLSMSKN